MLISQGVPFVYRGQQAEMQVVRNDGYCWGRFMVGEESFDVSTAADHYEQPDDEASAAFVRASRNPRCVSGTPN
jgi:hypothetical protein